MADPTKCDLVEPLVRLTNERTTIVISHDLLTTRDADHVVVLDTGRVAERGTHDDLVAAGGIYSHPWALQRAEEGTDEPVPALSQVPRSRLGTR